MCGINREQSMARSENQKLKVLHLAAILYQYSDPEHGMTMTDIIAKLQERGISAERKSLYRDLAALKDFGLDIRSAKVGTNTEYRLASRAFDITELQLIMDAIQSSRFLSREQADRLASRLQLLTSFNYRWMLEGSVQVEGRSRTDHKGTLENVNSIRQALQQRRQVEFKYLEYTVDGTRRPRKNGKVYCETPISLIHSNDLYYMISFNSDHETILTYRVDRMAEVAISSKRAVLNNRIASYDPVQFEEQSFSMFGGELINAVLSAKPCAMDAMVDRFGESALSGTTEDGRALFKTSLMASPTFYGWLAQFKGDVTVVSPKHLAVKYQAHLESTLSAIERTKASATRKPSTAADMMPPA